MPETPQNPAQKKAARKPRVAQGIWKQGFIAMLAQTGNVAAAAQSTQVDRSHAYHARKTDPEFDAAWRAAIEQAADVLELEARRRAVQGVKEPVFYHGKEVSAVTKYSDVLLIFLLKGARPEKYRDRIEIAKIPTEALEDELRRVEAELGLAPGQELPEKS